MPGPSPLMKRLPSRAARLGSEICRDGEDPVDSGPSKLQASTTQAALRDSAEDNKGVRDKGTVFQCSVAVLVASSKS